MSQSGETRGGRVLAVVVGICECKLTECTLDYRTGMAGLSGELPGHKSQREPETKHLVAD